jgi:hypothetical protein
LLLLIPFATKTFSQPPYPSQIPEPQIAYALHATWDPDLTDNNPSVCTTSGTVAVPWFHFYAGWKDGAPAFFSVDWVLIEELTNEHEPQVWYFENPQGSSGFPYGCTMPPVSDPQNWNWTTWSFAPMIGFAMHNTAYRVTVQWRYGVYMKGPRGPFQTSITINVQNLVVTSPDETKVLKWDPVREIADTTFSYSLECAQRKWCQVKVSIYSTDGMKVYEEWLEKLAPGSYSFTWDGSVNVVPPPPPDGKAPAGLYVFDIEVIGIAPGYDEDWLKSKLLRVGEHFPKYVTSRVVEGWYVLYSIRDAYEAWMEVYNPDLDKVTTAQGTTHSIPEGTQPSEQDWNKTARVWVGFDKVGVWRFVFWARDDCIEFYKSHCRKLAHATNQKRIDWILSGGFNYEDLDTTKTAREIGKIVNEIGYIPQGNMQDSPQQVVIQIADIACNKNETKDSNGLISFLGHGGGIFVDAVISPLRRLYYIHQPHTDCLRFPRGESERRWLGTNPPPDNYQCPTKLPECRGDREYEVGNIRNFVIDNERKEKPLSNVLIVTLFGCVTNTDIKGDFAEKLKELGVKSILGIKGIVGATGYTRKDIIELIKEWDNIFKDIWVHLSHGATLTKAIQTALENNKSIFSNVRFIIIYPGTAPCNMPGRFERIYLRSGKLIFHDETEVTYEHIFRITGESDITIISDSDKSEKVKKIRGRCRCVEVR